MNIEHISVSRRQTWDQCQLQYKYKYHLKVLSPEPEPIYFAYGTTIHKIAEEYVQTKGARTITEIANDVVNGKILLKENSRCPNLPQAYKAKLPNHLRALKALTDRVGFEGHLEWKFEYDLEPPNQKFILGFIDRLIPKGDKFFIIDYKTTKKGPWRKNSQTIIDDLQLRCYARVVQKTFGAKANDIRCALYYLDEKPELVSAKFSEDSLLRAEEEMHKAYDDIKKAKPEVWGNYGDHCTRCNYRSLCPVFNASFP